MIAKIGFSIALALAVSFQNVKTTSTVVVDEVALGAGSQPEISVNGLGEIRIVFGLKKGKERDLYFVSSTDGGQSFSKPYLLGDFADMGLGMGRGPQIAATKDYTVVTVGDHHGNMYAMRLTNKGNVWSAAVKVQRRRHHGQRGVVRTCFKYSK